MRAGLISTFTASALFWSSGAMAQTLVGAIPIDPDWSVSTPPEPTAGGLRQDERPGRWTAGSHQSFDIEPGSLQAARILPLTDSLVADATLASNPIRIERTDLWRDTPEGGRQSLRLTTAAQLRRPDGAPLPFAFASANPGAAGWLEPQAYDVRYDYHWPSARTTTASGWQVALTPHAGVGYGTQGGSAQAGATLRLGRDLESMVPSGSDVFGDRARWYLFAAGEGRAVGYNFARNRDGGFVRSGMSHDEGAFLGDATVGVAWRRGAMQASVGLTYREIEAEGLRLGRRRADKVEEGLVAFQLSIKP